MPFQLRCGFVTDFAEGGSGGLTQWRRRVGSQNLAGLLSARFTPIPAALYQPGIQIVAIDLFRLPVLGFE